MRVYEVRSTIDRFRLYGPQCIKTPSVSTKPIQRTQPTPKWKHHRSPRRAQRENASKPIQTSTHRTVYLVACGQCPFQITCSHPHSLCPSFTNKRSAHFPPPRMQWISSDHPNPSIITIKPQKSVRSKSIQREYAQNNLIPMLRVPNSKPVQTDNANALEPSQSTISSPAKQLEAAMPPD